MPPSGNGPSPRSSSPRLIVDRAMPVILETIAKAPYPAASTSAAANSRRPRSSSLQPIDSRADGSLEAARIAKMAHGGGASALLVFPPAPFTLGQSADMAIAHFKRIADACDLPLIAFQYPLATGQGYPKDTLLRLCEEVPTLGAIKDWSNKAALHEWHVRTLQSLTRPVSVLSAHSAWLMSSLVLGCHGLLSGSGSVIHDLQARLFRAVQSNELAEAKRLNDCIYATVRVFYADPVVDMHNRMKEALVLLGKLPLSKPYRISDLARMIRAACRSVQVSNPNIHVGSQAA